MSMFFQKAMFFIIICLAVACQSNNISECRLTAVDSQSNPLPDTQIRIHTTAATAKRSAFDSTLITNNDGFINFEYPYECFLVFSATKHSTNGDLFGEIELHLEPNNYINDTIILW